MSVTVRPFAAGLGADISGVDIHEPLSTADRAAIRAAWLANLVLRFRGQPMTDEQHMAFTLQFGELEFNPAALIAKQYGVETQTAGRKRETPPEISVISNIVEDDKAIGGLGDGEAFWHTDSSFVDVPPAASLLRARSAAAERRRRDLVSQLLYRPRHIARGDQEADRRADDDSCRDPFQRRQGA
jgi:taurine dioxygenase